tara:strand:- start:18 stop:164 length:147 start_codon:yes stop_codon:yes gene_type:complete
MGVLLSKDDLAVFPEGDFVVIPDCKQNIKDATKVKKKKRKRKKEEDAT